MIKKLILLFMLFSTIFLFSSCEKTPTRLHVHSYGGNEWTENDGKMTNKCVVCGEDVSIDKCETHSFSSWDYNSEDSKRSCSVCYYKDICSHDWDSSSWEDIEDLSGGGDVALQDGDNPEDIPLSTIIVNGRKRICGNCKKEEICKHEGTLEETTENGKTIKVCSVCGIKVK